MSLPTISIVTPSFNQGQFLERTIQSVLSQEYPKLEYLVLDGGSTDASVAIIEKYSDRLAFWRSHADKGQSDAICEGWRRSSGDILAWLNSDDYYYPNVLAGVGEFFAGHPEVMVLWGGIAIVDEGGALLRVKPAKPLSAVDLLVFKDVPGQAAGFLRRSVFERLGGPRADLYYVMDWELWLRIALAYPASAIALVPEVLAGATEWSGAKTVTAEGREIHEVRRILAEVYARKDLAPEVRTSEKKAYARTWWRQSKTELRMGHRRKALSSLVRSLWTSPATILPVKTLRQFRRIAANRREL